MKPRHLVAALLSTAAIVFGQTPTNPPNPTTITVVPSTVVRTLDPRFYGVNVTMWDSNLKDSQTSPYLDTLSFGSMRLPGGSLSDDYDWQTNKQVSSNPNWTWTNSVPDMAKVAEAHHLTAYVTVNYGSGTPEEAAALVAYLNGSPSNGQSIAKDAKGRDWNTVGYWAGLRAASPLASDDGMNFLRINHPQPFGFTYFEVGNENYGSWEYDQHGVNNTFLTGAQHDPYTYAQYFKDFKPAMLAVDPTIKIGSPIEWSEDSYGTGTHAVTNSRTSTSHTGWTPVMLATMKSLNVVADFFSYHYYPQNSPNETDNGLLQRSPTELPPRAAAIRQQLKDYLGDSTASNIELAMTEINSISDVPGKQTSNLVEALYYADAYGTIAQTEFKDAQWWALHNDQGDWQNKSPAPNMSASLYGWRMFGSYNMITGNATATQFPGMSSETPLPVYYAAKALTHWARPGDQIVSATTNYTWLSAYAAQLANGKTALLVVNKHPSTDVTAQVTLQGVSGSATASVYSYGKTNDAAGASNPDLSTSTQFVNFPTFSYTFPSYSLTVIQLDSTPTVPVITAQPQNTSSTIGGTATFSVTAGGTAPLTYQWYKDNAAIGGATSATLTVSNVQQSDFGTYTVKITNLQGTTTSNGVTLSLTTAYLANVSMRASVGGGNPDPIVGIVVGGSTPTPILVRGSGPALLPFGVSGYLPDPIVQIFDDGANKVGENNDHASIVDAVMPSYSVGFNFGVGSKDAALVQTLQPPHGYTAHLTATSGSGVGLVEMYTNTPGSLLNISANAKVGTGDNVLIAGFVVAGTGNLKVLVRASGPALIPLGVGGTLADPKLEVHDGTQALIASNDNWDADSSNASAVNTASAAVRPGFAQAAGSKDAALVMSLAPGAYTVVVSGVNNTTGIAVAEVYIVP